MPGNALIQVASSLGRDASRVESTSTDRDLLMRFLHEHDEEAFEILVRRHERLVRSAIAKVQLESHDREDAFQATFLVLVRRAKSIHWRVGLGAWLYGVAHRVAVKARATSRKRLRKEKQVRSLAEQPDQSEQPCELSWQEACALLHTELDKLPDRYRLPLLFCYLEGKTRDEAAKALKVSLGTLRGWLERGRELLRARLASRGVTLSAGLLAAVASNQARATLRPVSAVLEVARGSASERVLELTREAVSSTVLAKIATTLAVVIGLAAIATAVFATGGEQPAVCAATPAARPTTPDADGGKQSSRNEKAASISGRVVNPEGKPVVGAEVLGLSNASEQPRLLGKTDADGRFSVTVEMGGVGVAIVARTPGLGIAFRVLKEPSSAPLTLQLPKDNPIRGRLIDTQGKPVAGATVAVTELRAFDSGTADGFLNEWKSQYRLLNIPHGDSELDLSRHGALLRATTDQDGRFELRGCGCERVVHLNMSARGIADTQALVLNRAKFDPEPVNRAVAANTPALFKGDTQRFILFGPEPCVVAEQEKLIRGVVKDRDTGKRLAGVEVVFLRVSDEKLLTNLLRSVTNADGEFEIRGSAKHKSYVLETYSDPKTGYIACQVELKDTPGYEPVVAEIGCAKGVIVTGQMRDKATGKPLAGVVWCGILRGNSFAAKFPTFDRSASMISEQNWTKDNGTFRLVTLPGPVLLVGTVRNVPQSAGRIAYARPKADPNYPQYFSLDDGALRFDSYRTGSAWVGGNWCKVLNLKPGDTVTQDIEVEPASRTSVKIVDESGKPVLGVEAAGVDWEGPSASYHQKTDTAVLFGLEPKEERLVVVGHRAQRLVGGRVVTVADKDPVVVLGRGGTLTGRIVDASGKPVVGVQVALSYENMAANTIHELLTKRTPIVTDANGKFAITALIPGQRFHVSVHSSKHSLLPDQKWYRIEKHGDTLAIGDFTLTPKKEEE